MFPELVSENKDGYKQVDFTSLPFYIIEALKELWFKVSGLEEKIKEIDELERRIERLEAIRGAETQQNSNHSSNTTPPLPEGETQPDATEQTTDGTTAESDAPAVSEEVAPVDEVAADSSQI